MKKNVTKCSIYSGIFSTFLVIYLVMMAGFSIFLIAQEKKVTKLELQTVALQISRTVEDVLKDNIDSNHQITDIAKVKKEFVRQSGYFSFLETEVAVFTSEYDLICNTNGYWLCSYTEYREGKTNYTGYAYLNPNDWFSEEEIAELKNYLYTTPKAENAGDLVGYSVSLEGFWVDNEMIIPDKISVIAMYANTFDKKGNVDSSSGTHTDDIVYSSGYINTKGLPYFEHGRIQPNDTGYPDSEKQIELRHMILDKEKLKKTVEQIKPTEAPRLISYERVDLLNYRYYLLVPYRNTVNMTDNQTPYSEFWTVVAREVNLWDKCAGTLAFVWLSCFITFFAAATIISRQTYKTYRKREAFERQRQETTNALAHDLKTPLCIISGYAQNLIENIHTEKSEYYAGSILANVNHMDKIIMEMLELSRLESGLCEVEFEDVALGEVGGEIIKRYKQVCDEKSITVSLEGDATAQSEYSLIARVIDNFFVNALDHTPEGGIIRIRIIDNTLEIYNSGSHIPEDKMNEIWLPYKKVDISRSNTKGTGLGLAISRTILELYQFPYGVRNTDEGVLFWFKFT